VSVCVCVRVCVCACACQCMCVCERESVCVCVRWYVYVSVRERETECVIFSYPHSLRENVNTQKSAVYWTRFSHPTNIGSALSFISNLA